jgi:hypothetical protein
MVKKGFLVGLLIMVLAVGLVLTGCSGRSSALVGRWHLDAQERIHSMRYNLWNPADMELFKDGTGIVQRAGSSANSITWKTENGRFYLIDGSAESWSYTASGATLILTTDRGTILHYKKD